MSEASSPAPSLRHRILRAGSWSLAGHVISNVLRLGSSLVMTRLLAPELFGVMTIVFSVMVTVALLADIGLRQAIVQSKHGDDQEYLDTAFTLQAIRGVLVWLACVAVAVLIGSLRQQGVIGPKSVYANPDLPWAIAATCFSVVITGFDSTKIYTADRRLELKRVSLIEVYSLVTSIVVTIALALSWKSIWPIVIGNLASAFVTLWLSHAWLHGPRDRFRWNRSHALEMWHYGKWIALSSMMSVLAMNGDRLLLGAWATDQQMGYYYVALTLVFAVESAASRLSGNVAAPALSEVFRNDRSRLREVFWRLRMPVDAAAIVASGLLFALGQTIVDVLYDPRYRPAGHVLGILALGLLASRFHFCNSVYIAAGKAKYQTLTSAARMVALLAMLSLGHHWLGIEGAFWGIALHTVLVVPVYWFFNHRFDLLDWRKELTLLAIWPLAYAAGWSVAWVFKRLFGVG
jgi:O-antigen/teichoic acid export membrane protein